MARFARTTHITNLTRRVAPTLSLSLSLSRARWKVALANLEDALDRFTREFPFSRISRETRDRPASRHRAEIGAQRAALASDTEANNRVYTAYAR